MSSSSERARGAKRTLRAILWIAGLAAALTAIGILRHLKTIELMQPSPLPSVELVRRQVERTLDPKASEVDLDQRQVTVREIVEMARPPELDSQRSTLGGSRFAPFETHLWGLKATVKEAFLRDDGDLFLVIDDHGARSSAEIPDPKQCIGSPFHDRISQVRSALEKDLQPTRSPKAVNRDAVLSGIGFFGTAGGRSNGARIEPLLDIRWVEG